jgi:hypothetical protein
MYQKDYILRMIEMLFKFLGELMEFIQKGELDHSGKMLEESYNIFLREDAAFFRNIPEEKLTDWLLNEHNYTSGHLEVLAELFNAEAELRLARNDMKGCIEFSKKSLRLFEFVDSEYRTYSEERMNKMDTLRSRLSEIK